MLHRKDTSPSVNDYGASGTENNLLRCVVVIHSTCDKDIGGMSMHTLGTAGVVVERLVVCVHVLLDVGMRVEHSAHRSTLDQVLMIDRCSLPGGMIMVL
jgi:hypothetical protein